MISRRALGVAALAVGVVGCTAGAAFGAADGAGDQSPRSMLAEAVIGSSGPKLRIVSDTEIHVGDERFDSWNALEASGYFAQEHTKCGAWHIRPQAQGEADFIARGNAFDCSSFNTTIRPEYDPAVARYRIPVVVHVIQNTSGIGFISPDRVRSQIDILNEDFQAILGSEGEDGDNAEIEFYLADVDPQGNGNNGITYSTNNTWFNDGGSYWNSLAVDPDRYLNIYTNSASGALGYVPFIPQNSPGSIGGNSDRVVVLYSTFGRDAPFAPFDLGRTGTHEVGHYLGLYHTFSGGCGPVSSCSSNGDLICDTNPESSPTFGCQPNRFSCGLPAPSDNYMDYSDDICMRRFTPDQINRMRCTMLNFRPGIFEVVSDEPCPADINEDGQATSADFTAWLACFNDPNAASYCADNADVNGDGSVTSADFTAWLEAFQNGCP